MAINKEDLIAFYSAVEEFGGYGDCDDVVFCDCGASWPARFNSMRDLKMTLNSLRLHRRRCVEPSITAMKGHVDATHSGVMDSDCGRCVTLAGACGVDIS
jgi:hypothetical protein